MTPLFRLVVRNQVSVFGGPSGGTKYDLSAACPVCGTGAIQVGPLMLRGRRTARFQLFSTLDDEILCDADLANAFEANGMQRCLGEVLDSKTRESLPVKQLRPQAVLPPFSAGTNGLVRERPCRECGRDGYFGIPHVVPTLGYARLEPRLSKSDLLATWERFGNSRLREPFSDSVFAAPLYLVSERLSLVLKAEKVKGIDFEPVLLS